MSESARAPTMDASRFAASPGSGSSLSRGVQTARRIILAASRRLPADRHHRNNNDNDHDDGDAAAAADAGPASKEANDNGNEDDAVELTGRIMDDSTYTLPLLQESTARGGGGGDDEESATLSLFVVADAQHRGRTVLVYGRPVPVEDMLDQLARSPALMMQVSREGLLGPLHAAALQQPQARAKLETLGWTHGIPQPAEDGSGGQTASDVFGSCCELGLVGCGIACVWLLAAFAVWMAGK
jgi:hypothetical protein